MAKLGLYGLELYLAIEGRKNNIFVNCHRPYSAVRRND